jgi:hypothetical protein
VSDKIHLNPFSGLCESCKQNCKVGGCNFEAVSAYCMVCSDDIGSRSTVASGDDCLECPSNCVGCRDRSHSEQDAYNPFFLPENPKNVYYQRMCYECDQTDIDGRKVFYNSIMGRCVACDSDDAEGCYTSASVDVYMYCQSGKSDHEADADAYKYVDMTDYFQSRTSAQAVIQFFAYENDDNYGKWNSMVANKITFNLQLM